MLFPLLLVVLVGFAAAAQEPPSQTTARWVTLILGTVFLIIATAASGWYFGNKAHRVPFLIGIASFSAACGIGVGFSPEAAFAAIVPALAVGYGGALVCAVSVGGKASTSTDVITNGSAASGIPLMLGAYFGNSLRTPWPTDPRWLLTAILIVLITLITALLVARRKEDLPLPLAAAAFGAFIGLLTGLSLHPVVGYVAPAALALFAGTASYAFTASREEQKKIGGILLSFGVLLIFGLIMGAVVRLGLGWDGALRTLFAFGTILLVSLGFGASVGALHKDIVSGLGFAARGGGVGLAIGMSQTFVMHIVGPALLTILAGLTFYVFIADYEERKMSLKLLAAFGVVVLLGSFIGYSLRQGDFRDLLKRAEEKIEENGIEPGDVTAEREPGVEVDVRTVVADATEQLDRLIWLEGSEHCSAILIQVAPRFQGLLKIEERVDGILLYNQYPPADEPIVLAGESLRVRWPVAAGPDAVSIRAWDRMVRGDINWTVEGDGELLDLELAEVRGDEFVLDYPP